MPVTSQRPGNVMKRKYNEMIIIPDVHGRSFWKDAADRFPSAEFIFLGDYLDPYVEEKISDEQAYRGLLEILEFKKTRPEEVTLLWGNHDLHYLQPNLLSGLRGLLHIEP